MAALDSGREYIRSIEHPPVGSIPDDGRSRLDLETPPPFLPGDASGTVLRGRRRVTMVHSVTRAPNTVSTPRRTTLLVILDGFGHRTATEDNAILAAQTPNLDRLRRDASHTLVSGSGPDVGLPEG